MKTIDSELRRILADVLGVPSSDITEDASPATLDRWDSLRHMSLIVALEEEFGVVLDDEALDEATSFSGARSAITRLLDRRAA